MTINVPPVQIPGIDWSLSKINYPQPIDVGGPIAKAFQQASAQAQQFTLQQQQMQMEQQKMQQQASMQEQQMQMQTERLSYDQQKWATELGIDQQKLQATAQKAARDESEDTLKVAGTVSTSILMADSSQKPALYEQAKQLAGTRGVDVTSWPEKWGPQAEQLMKGLSVVSGQALAIASKGGPAMSVTTPEGTNVQMGGGQSNAGALGIFPQNAQTGMTNQALVNKQVNANTILKQSDEDALTAGNNLQQGQLAKQALATLRKNGVKTGPGIGTASMMVNMGLELGGSESAAESNAA